MITSSTRWNAKSSTLVRSSKAGRSRKVVLVLVSLVREFAVQIMGGPQALGLLAIRWGAIILAMLAPLFHEGAAELE